MLPYVCFGQSRTGDDLRDAPLFVSSSMLDTLGIAICHDL
jgi:hypothetical protein